jgi:hypothetical protein
MAVLFNALADNGTDHCIQTWTISTTSKHTNTHFKLHYKKSMMKGYLNQYRPTCGQR